MKTTCRFVQLSQACAFGAAAVLAVPACAAEPALLDATELAGVPRIESVAQLAMPPGTAEAPPSAQAGGTWAVAGQNMRAVDLGKLDQERGRADTVLNDTKLNGDVANNSAVNVSTGSNTIDAGSFANMSGIPVVIQNSGANVLIQNATVVNLQFQ